MFDRIARVYDVLNTVMTRRPASPLARARGRPGGRRSGRPRARRRDRHGRSGDRARAARRSRRRGRGQRLLRGDARAGAAQAQPAGAELRFEWGDALALPYADGAFDAATVGFGARNFSDLARGLAEMVRVVRPGGRVVVLEFTSPTRAAAVDLLPPVVRPRRAGCSGRLAGDPDAYSYLPDSVQRFPAPAGLAAVMERAGLREIRYLLTAGGIVAIHVGTVPLEGS